MTNNFKIRNGTGWDLMWGGTGSTGPTGPIDRTPFIGDYSWNPVYYSGTPQQGGDYNTNRVGIFGPSTLVSEQEGANVTHSTNGQTFDSIHFYRRVTPAAQNLVYKNCFFQGTPTDYQAPVTCSSAQVNTTFIDCTFAPLSTQYNTPCVRAGLGGGSFIRCDFYGGTDGVSNSSTTGWPSQWDFIQCAFHDQIYTSPDPDAAGGLSDNASHLDTAAQWGGGRMRMIGCGLWGFYDMTPHRYQAADPNTAFGTGSTTDNVNKYPYHFTGNKYTDTVNVPGDARTPQARVGYPSIYSLSLVMFSPIYRAIDYFEMDNCYLDGTSYALNMGNASTTISSGNFKFTNNKVGTNHRWDVNGTHQAIIARSSIWPTMTISGNTDLKTGAALTSTDLLKNG